MVGYMVLIIAMIVSTIQVFHLDGTFFHNIKRNVSGNEEFRSIDLFFYRFGHFHVTCHHSRIPVVAVFTPEAKFNIFVSIVNLISTCTVNLYSY